MDAEVPRARFVRQFALTKGRARPTGELLALDTLVRVTEDGAARSPKLPSEQRRIAELCQQAISIAEIAAHLHVHLGIARVLVSDMVARGLVALSAADFDENGPDLGTLERLLDDLEAL